MKTRKIAMVLALAAIALGPFAAAADTSADKAGRGLAAITTPFLEIPGNIVATADRDGFAAGWTVGLARGIGMTVLRPLVGVYELVSAPFPAPDNFEPILSPEYPWSYFGDGDSSVAYH